ncbi:MAG TPA: class I SAM-dependent methyltransferase [Anaerolineae bacterium]
MADIVLKPPPKPNYLTKAIDFCSRAVRGQLHLPPWWLRDVGGADFEAVGQEFLEIFKQLAGLQPNERVLDIGCGSGRIALPLTGYLNSEGGYTGLDIVNDSISWCRQHITTRYPNFQFVHADLYNRRYNPTGQFHDETYTFPFESGRFDFIFLTSVFTHMLPAGLENYLSEIARVLHPNGRALVTFFLLDGEQQTLASQGQNDIDFKFGSGSYRVRSEAVPESAVAYEQAFVRQTLRQKGLDIVEPIHYGTWSGRVDGLSYQDIVLVRPAR